MQLDDWVLCRIYNKKSSAEKIAMEQKESSLDETMDSFEVKDEKDVEILPALNSIEHSSIKQTNPSFLKSSKIDPHMTNYNVMSSDDYSMKYNINLQNPGLQQTTMPFNAGSVKVPVQTPTVNPFPSTINQWANYNSADIISGQYTDSSSSKPSSSEPISEKEEVQSSFKLEAFSQGEQQHSFFNFDQEGLQNPFPQLDQLAFPDSYQDYFLDYLPRFCPNDMLLQ